MLDGLADGGQDSATCLVEGSFQNGTRSQAMAASAELFRQLCHIDAPRAEADFHPAARLLHEEQANFDVGEAARVVNQVLAVLRHSSCCGVVVAMNLGISHSSA